MEIGPRFPGSDDVITSGKITLSESEKIETERRMQIENSRVLGTFNIRI